MLEDGSPKLSVERAGKSLKSIPKSHAKDPGFAALRQRAKDLGKQASRVKESLETSMVRGDVFDDKELQDLGAHPILGPGFRRVVFLSGETAGYLTPPAKGRKTWQLTDHAKQTSPISAKSELRVAHPSDLLQRGDWHAWQAECFTASRVQPFKQVFRELYPKTQDELKNGKQSARYAGHQLTPARPWPCLENANGWPAQKRGSAGPSATRTSLRA